MKTARKLTLGIRGIDYLATITGEGPEVLTVSLPRTGVILLKKTSAGLTLVNGEPVEQINA